MNTPFLICLNIETFTPSALSSIESIKTEIFTLSLFLDFRSAFLAALGLPVAFFGAFIVMQYTGASLNVITMFGLIMVLGIVVDDAIIVVENVKRHIQKGLKPKDAEITPIDPIIELEFA